MIISYLQSLICGPSISNAFGTSEFLLFQVTFFLFIVFYQIFDYAEKGLSASLDIIGRQITTEEDPAVTNLRTGIYVSYYFIIAFRGIHYFIFIFLYMSVPNIQLNSLKNALVEFKLKLVI